MPRIIDDALNAVEISSTVVNSTVSLVGGGAVGYCKAASALSGLAKAVPILWKVPGVGALLGPGAVTIPQVVVPGLIAVAIGYGTVKIVKKIASHRAGVKEMRRYVKFKDG